ncbi:uncharacterized protein LOC134769954 [Penaeus indicus]|uniref:uncharacterized protein LOC134769954 n=1 Tax=Penaeus indicus TaxID=29960 RepID=UPI00300D2A71
MAALITFLLVILSTSALGQVPEGCIDPPGNNGVADIIVQALEAARSLLESGIPELGIPPLDPFGPLPKIPFSVDTSGLWLEGIVNDTYVRNLAQFVTCSVNLTFGLAQKFDIEFRLQNFHMDGYYDVDGLALSLFPIFGNGGFRIDTYESGFTGGAKISYNPISDHASLKDLSLDIFFSTMELEMECILGCGDMSDIINGAASEIAPFMFNAIWDYISPILSTALQDGINDILKNISISDIITPEERRMLELGNANGYLDLVMANLGPLMEAEGLDPAPLPDANLNFGTFVADLYDGQLTGLSTIHRDGTCTLDRVADWLFLYANVAVENLGVHQRGRVTSGDTTVDVEVDATISSVALYFVARGDVYSLEADIDQFIISEFGKIDVRIDGLGSLDYVMSPLAEAVANLVRDDVSRLLETKVKQAIQDALNETPWPVFE